ncbi:hypothetical protein B0H12DRAFT_1239881 [Mycena haematopus]|nr:hypothetical protein B0H12DRAFT_1239881 [Mycena haematopus]
MSQAVKLAFMFDNLLYGIIFCQTWLYFHWWPADGSRIKSIVAGILIVETTEMVIFAVSFDTKYDNMYSTLDSVQVLFTCLSGLIIQMYFILGIRSLLGGLVRQFTNYTLSIATFIAFILALTQFCAAIIQTVLSCKIRSFTGTPSIQKATIIQTMASSACDLTVIVTLCAFLSFHGSGPIAKSSERMFKTLMMSAIIRGALTTLTSAFSLTLYLSFPGTYWFMLGLAPCSKLFAFSLLSNLNIRAHARRGGNSIQLEDIYSPVQRSLSRRSYVGPRRTNSFQNVVQSSGIIVPSLPIRELTQPGGEIDSAGIKSGDGTLTFFSSYDNVPTTAKTDDIV